MKTQSHAQPQPAVWASLARGVRPPGETAVEQLDRLQSLQIAAHIRLIERAAVADCKDLLLSLEAQRNLPHLRIHDRRVGERVFGSE